MRSEMTINYIITVVLVFILTALLLKKIIPILKSHKVGQKILEIGPRWHKSKEGTPVMGGIGFILSMLIVMTGFFVFYGIKGRAAELIPLALTLSLATINGMIGFVDDYTKLVKKQNEGLKAYQKFSLQVIAAVIYILVMKRTAGLETLLHIPYINVDIELGYWYYIFAVILITGIVNSVNLTDGIDGLASSETCVVGAFLGVVAFVAGSMELGFVSAMLVGGTLGFLVYNFYPARVFMGDTGSLFLGGMVVGAAFVMNEPCLVLVFGFMYVLEAISVILQVGCFKLTHRRIFKMAPIHHHFEKCGWKETKIVAVFSIMTLVFCVIAWFGLSI